MTILAALSNLAGPIQSSNNARLTSGSASAAGQGANGTSGLLSFLGLGSSDVSSTTTLNASVPNILTTSLTNTTTVSTK
ncbi:hypothetical protein SAMD00019534_016450 [Acytostelium subglobosum LB1]|uniref:hypothetical protein n=1 Tax=Acytostelium subglobosum LB1 TaxID=1410327 RepID=UPI000644898C|nr:hypothetical protein SAMD00019534_016450 [Acytostelium subglobosum LB1]GAM18470.1 hypothetical protein SAMD00019534_016450 [Acytostelium subglobosum LB1]|eukprot:XP_012757690.1 hypothetical protein SAMD00019534_016450 [Acytostelium subglobosum LB1]